MHVILTLKEQAGLAEPEPPSMWDDWSDTLALSKTQRIAGCVLSLIMGIVCLMIAISLAPMIVFTAVKFSFFFTFGNIFLLSSTMFLVGPMRQMRSMFDRSRAAAAASYIAALALTLVAALWLNSATLVTAFSTAQIVALVWYLLSYIPFARTVIRSAVGRIRVLLCRR
eukprot:TRINITY_DN9454_c0_g1_i2.p1 TRINITY_DN9454_c0_g1~~TRINITY_DN9454_c0_g1_i2.p1  ORF type:complete len:169 (+),score=23.88 TRINITY_DN9454_c0_g1_i2:88-594(+)